VLTEDEWKLVREKHEFVIRFNMPNGPVPDSCPVCKLKYYSDPRAKKDGLGVRYHLYQHGFKEMDCTMLMKVSLFENR
jgi:hypothetical protein